jgi:hypothetical protein
MAGPAIARSIGRSLGIQNHEQDYIWSEEVHARRGFRFHVRSGVLGTADGVGWLDGMDKGGASYPDGQVYIELVNKAENPGGCSATAYRHDTDPDRFLALVRSALMADREVSLKVGGCIGPSREALQVQVR